MISSQRMRASFKILALALSLAMPLAFVASSADARIGGGSSMGSRGMRTWSAPPSTPSAPNAASPFQRSITPNNGFNNPGMNSAASQQRGGFFNRPGLLGGLAAGFLGAGLLGMLFGGGMFGGLGGLSSIFGLIIQLGLIYLVARLVMNWWARRNGTPAYANMAPPSNAGQQHYGTQSNAQSNANAAFGFGKGATPPPLDITPADYETFERRLSEIQTAWSNEDIAALHQLATPEMVSYFTEDLAANKARGVINKVTGVKLLQGDLAEAWREGPADYATLGLRYSLVDKTFDRASNRVVDGGDTPQEVTEVWTFTRRPGADWELSAIQQA
jgi:predicted lipid-binding transport protein (Tim44 family)